MQQPIKGGAVNPQRQHREERLLIIEKTYDMLKYADQCVTQFPKKERYRTATGIMQCAWNLMDLFLEARYPEYRVAALRRADIELDKLRYKIRFVMDLTFLPFKKYENLASMVDEIGRMLGAWKKRLK